MDQGPGRSGPRSETCGSPTALRGRSGPTPYRRYVDRVPGIDVARGLAVLGMMTAHVGPDWSAHAPAAAAVVDLADGRPSALFVVLAGLSLALLSGGPTPARDRDLTRARVRIAVRAVVVLGVGLVLEALGTPVLVILPTYAVLFLLGCLVLRWPVRALVTAAALVALVAPAVRDALGVRTDATDVGGVVGLLVGPHYPALVWAAYLLAGLALGRCDLGARAVRWRTAVVGAALGVVGYGGGWVAQQVLPGSVLTSTAPHSSSTFEVVGNTGVALLVVALAVGLAPRAPHLAAPVAAVGALAFTAYTVHVVAIALLGDHVVWQPTTAVWLAFLLTTTALCWAWRATLGRGPLERGMHALSAGLADALVPHRREPVPR
ncbi:hypothetical protein Celgi_2354 [Cellulomonas gilvus ATCC 13127]|uniref:Heparan-alpha-glucosaminide N-acetyltransferase catalytic domain-containing protein n=1 Tax=Cellulomonas gilvus (strain ATCC 13127 / NRRL B-14078) TaxID=593907 RepID=F8A1H0_CELGA|nr:hypothetical protein Celgi_2354 [Cellulomonas gilvus ATCC 13127]